MNCIPQVSYIIDRSTFNSSLISFKRKVDDWNAHMAGPVSALQLLAHPQALLTASAGDGCVCLWGFNHASFTDASNTSSAAAGSSSSSSSSSLAPTSSPSQPSPPPPPPPPPQLFKTHASTLPLDALPAQPPRCHTMLGLLTNGTEDRAALVK